MADVCVKRQHRAALAFDLANDGSLAESVFVLARAFAWNCREMREMCHSADKLIAGTDSIGFLHSKVKDLIESRFLLFKYL